MKGRKIEELIRDLDIKRVSGSDAIAEVSGDIDDFLDNYAHGPQGNILGRLTFRREYGARTVDGETRVYAIFERAVIAKPEPHIGMLFVVENREDYSTTAVEISQS